MIKIHHADRAPIAQGDCYLIPVDALPAGVRKADDTIYAHSETGHHHVAYGDATLYHTDDPLLSYLVTRGPVEARHLREHETHESYELRGEGEVVWEIRRQREYTPEGWRQVMD